MSSMSWSSNHNHHTPIIGRPHSPHNSLLSLSKTQKGRKQNGIQPRAVFCNQPTTHQLRSPFLLLTPLPSSCCIKNHRCWPVYCLEMLRVAWDRKEQPPAPPPARGVGSLVVPPCLLALRAWPPPTHIIPGREISCTATSPRSVNPFAMPPSTGLGSAIFPTINIQGNTTFNTATILGSTISCTTSVAAGLERMGQFPGCFFLLFDRILLVNPSHLTYYDNDMSYKASVLRLLESPVNSNNISCSIVSRCAKSISL